MNTIRNTIALASAALLMTACYDDYVADYYYSGVYVAYQYDLRTFVLGEQERFDFTVGLAGVIDNTSDRKVSVVLDDSLLDGDLSAFGDGECSSFTALDGLLGKAPIGALCQDYVSTEVAAAGISSLTPLPAECYTVSGLDGMTIRKGRHTAAATVSATDALSADEKALKPYYALAFRVISADADTLLKDKSFEIIAVKCENRFYGNWYHGGKTVVIEDSTGDELSEEVYPFSIPQEDSRIYSLSTVAADAVVTNRMGNAAGSLRLRFAPDGSINVSSADNSVQITSTESSFNGAKLLQDRELYLSYNYPNGDGSTTYVTDTLYFRNRIRDGVNEWQDENPENYK